MIACAGDVPTLEALAAIKILRERLPDLQIRFVNVVDLMRLQDEREHPHGLTARDFDTVFTADKPVIFAYHGYPWLIHRLTYRRTNHDNIHVRGYKEEGTTTTPFDMVMMNDLDRFHLVMDVIDRVPVARARGPRRCARRWATLRRRARAVDARPRRGPARGAATGRGPVPSRTGTRSPSTTAEPADPGDPGRLSVSRAGRAPAGRSRAPRRSGPPGRSPARSSVLIGRAPRPRSGCAPGPARAQGRRDRRGRPSNPGVVLTDPGGEHDGVSAPEHGEIRADVLAEPVAVDVERRPRPLVAASIADSRSRRS